MSKNSDFNVADKIRVSNEVKMKGFEERGKYVVVNGEMVKEEVREGEDYDHMLSMFDDFAGDGNPYAVGYGYEIGDMVWGKVKSHPWWPGHIYSEEFASAALRKNKREGHVLVAFFGDSSYGWFELAELIPFEPNFEEKSRQSSSKNFVRAVEEAVDEVNRRSWLGLACRCRNPYNFRATAVEGFLAVHVGDGESGGVFSASQITRARDSFKPGELLAFIKKVAVTPMTNDHSNINFVKHKAVGLAYRKAKFEEFDETYAQAFGTRSLRPDPKTATGLQREPRAPLSGPLVFAETLGKGKASAKPTKPKSEVETDRYLFKRRDESRQSGIQEAGKEKPPREPSQFDRGSMSGRATTTSTENQVHQTIWVGDVSQSPSDEPTSVTKSVGDNGSKMHAEGSEPGPKKSKAKKRLAGQLPSDNSIASEKKKKKRKKEAGVEFSSDRNQRPVVSGVVGASLVDDAGKMVYQVASAAELDFQCENQGSNNESTSLRVTSAAEGSLKNQRVDDAALTSMPLDSVETNQTDGSKSSKAELRKYICDLRALALDPFHGAVRRGPLLVRKIFLKFRSLVYQKSLVSLVPAEADPSESRMSRLPSSAKDPNNHPSDYVNETLPVRPLKPPSRPEDSTVGGRKRGPSDRQEEVTAKKKKKMATMKSMTAEKNAPQKASDDHQGETRRGGGKLAALTSAKPVRFESKKRAESAAKLPDPTMLIMKFLPGATLPSVNELKVKFTRFGTLDNSKTRVFWQSSQVRVVYLHRHQAEAASRFASHVWNTNVRCFLRDLSADTSEPGQLKVEDAAVSTSKSGVELKQTPKFQSLPLRQPSQLKSCLKKSPVDELGSIGSGSNGSGRGTRVKFVLGEDELMVGNRNSYNNASFADGDVSSSSTSHAMDFNSKNIQKVVSSSSRLPSVPLFDAQFPQASNNVLFNEDPSRNTPNFKIHPLASPVITSTSDIDITQQMISLLTKCNDVVSSLKATLGYVPYHPL